MAKADKKKEKEEIKLRELLHLVFDAQGGELIQESFSLEEQECDYQGEILVLEEDFALGPISEIQEAAGWQSRKQWWQSVLEIPQEESPEFMVTDKMKLHDLVKRMENEPDLHLWIWMGQNPKDVCGYYWLISQLSPFQGRIQVLYLNNLPFINEKGQIFYPVNLSEILPKEFLKASRLARTVTLSEFELDPDEWKKLCQENGYVRTLEGGKKILSYPASYYDKLLLEQLGQKAVKLPRLLTLLHSKAKLIVPDEFLVWRIRELIALGQIISQGDWTKGQKNVVLKATGGEMFVDIENPTDESEEEISS